MNVVRKFYYGKYFSRTISIEISSVIIENKMIVVSLTSESFSYMQMEKVRAWMTEILLDVTNAEIQEVAHEVHKREKSKTVPGILILECFSSDAIFSTTRRGNLEIEIDYSQWRISLSWVKFVVTIAIRYLCMGHINKILIDFCILIGEKRSIQHSKCFIFRFYPLWNVLLPDWFRAGSWRLNS